MKVYVAELVYYYEGTEVLGVFTTPERAKEEGEKRRVVDYGDGPLFRGDELKVNEWEVEE